MSNEYILFNIHTYLELQRHSTGPTNDEPKNKKMFIVQYIQCSTGHWTSLDIHTGTYIDTYYCTPRRDFHIHMYCLLYST